MQKVVDALRAKGKIYKKMQEITPKELGIRNRIQLFKATDIHGFFWAIIVINQKSRVFSKDVIKMQEIYTKLKAHFDHNFKYKTIFIDAPLCSKASAKFKELGWRVY